MQPWVAVSVDCRHPGPTPQRCRHLTHSGNRALGAGAPPLPTMHLAPPPPPPLHTPDVQTSRDQEAPCSLCLPDPAGPHRESGSAKCLKDRPTGGSVPKSGQRRRTESRGAAAAVARDALGEQGTRSPCKETGESGDSGFPPPSPGRKVSSGSEKPGMLVFDLRYSLPLEQTDSDASTTIGTVSDGKREMWPARHTGVGWG